MSLSVTGVPSTDSFVPTVNGVLSQIVGGVSVPSWSMPLTATPLDFQFANSFADAIQGSASVHVGGRARLTIVEQFPKTTSAFVFDFGKALPRITRAAVDATDVARPKITWESAAPLTATDGGYVVAPYYDDRLRTMAWTFIVSPDATEVRAPTLPTDAAEWAPQVGGGDAGKPSKFEFPEILFAESDIFPDYAAFRREAGRLVSSYDSRTRRAERVVLPKVGTFRATAYAAAD